MANEAILRTETELPINKVVSSGAAIEKGAVLVLSGGNLVRASTATDTGKSFGGILAQEKISNDGITSAAVYDEGRFDMVTASGGAAISTGQIVCLSGANLIRSATEAEVNLGAGIGRTLEEGPAGTSATILVDVGRL